jgi:hypothetical protein
MEGPHAAHSRARSERLKQEQQLARQIMFVADQAFAERTEIPSVSDLRPPEARHGDQAEDGPFVRSRGNTSFGRRPNRGRRRCSTREDEAERARPASGCFCLEYPY